jgi:hypothetical protein
MREDRKINRTMRNEILERFTADLEYTHSELNSKD